VAVGAGEIAAAEKDQGGDPSRKIKETRPLKTFDSHNVRLKVKVKG
jgi:hypothetical protein